MEIALLLLGLGVAAWFGLRVSLGSDPPRDPAAEYERLADAYQASRMPYVLYGAVGKAAPPEEKAKHDRALAAFADFLLGLDDEGFTAVVMHLDSEMRKHGGDAPFDHVCEFLLEQIERVREDRRRAADLRHAFILGFIPSKHPALYVPYRPRLSRA